jgi:DNA invertase Pin-like site-specific DNA recombinase
MQGGINMRSAYGYVRVSTDEQADSGLGVEAQRQRIRAYCELKGLHLAETFEDLGVSGGKPLGTRQHGGRLLAQARRTRAVVVVAKLDRLFRSVADAAQTIADFEKKGLELVAIAEGFDMTNPYGRAMAQMASVFAELERAMIRERTRAAMKVKRDRRERISGHAPFGWDFGSDDSAFLRAESRSSGRGFATTGNVLRASWKTPRTARKQPLRNREILASPLLAGAVLRSKMEHGIRSKRRLTCL